MGRRPLVHEIPGGIDLIVDLTAEFWEGKRITRGRRYISFPVLDTDVPSCPICNTVVDEITAWPGKVYIHCASGHGRSATLAAAVLIQKGFAKSVREAILMIKRERPGIALSKKQRLFLQNWVNQVVEG
jgi:protein-tyrosine phosphatase